MDIQQALQELDRARDHHKAAAHTLKLCETKVDYLRMPKEVADWFTKLKVHSQVFLSVRTDATSYSVQEKTDIDFHRRLLLRSNQSLTEITDTAALVRIYHVMRTR